MKASVGYRDSVFSLRGLCRVLALVSVSATLTASAAFSDEGGAVSGSQVERQLDEGELDEAVGLFTRLVEAYPEDAHLRIRLGYAYLKRKDFKLATKTFKEAKNLDRTRPEAYVGLGLAHAERPARGLEAFYNFRRAIGEAKRATRLDSTYGPAYRLLGEIYERYEENHKKAIVYFTKYVELESDNPDGLYYFGRACVQAKEYEKIAQYIAPYVKAHPEKSRLLPLVAQAHFFLERFDLALEYFEHYLRTLDEAEHQLYTDVSLVASKKELEDLQATPEAERVAYLEQFWLRRDSDILTKINERIIEHYRRVWFARTFFSDKVHPWDKRGEVYIRYGEPDYRSRSTQRQFVQSAEVEQVRNNMAVKMYGAEATFLTFTGPVFPVRSVHNPNAAGLHSLLDESGVPEEADDPFDEEAATQIPEDAAGPQGSVGDGSGDVNPLDSPDSRFDEFGNFRTKLNFGGFAPITMGNEFGTVPWETWTYTKIGGGIEITFTDERGNGQFDFAPIPPPDYDTNVGDMARINEFAPGTIFANTAAQVPDYYRPSFQHPPLDFYYDLADFRASEGQTALEVYYGIPPEQVEAVENSDTSLVHVQCAVALANSDYTSIHRTALKHAYRVANRSDAQAMGSFMPELLKVEVPPGEYELQVQIKDLVSGRTGIYRQSVEVKEYPEDALRISDIQLAAAIEDTGSAQRFRKGEVWVVPMPTRNYRESQKFYAYYEIYNLSKDPFGQTRFSVRYLVRSISKPIKGALGSLAGGVRSLFKSKKPQVSITHEQTGFEPAEQGYVEIDLSKAKPGINILEVEIKDLVTGESATREIRFQYGG
jgi:GWxTD domain-containing protein